MAERLTPEQLEDFAAYSRGLAEATLEICDDPACHVCASQQKIAAVVEQAARDARTLARVRAWTETPASEFIIESDGYSRGRMWNAVAAEDKAKAEVAALLRAEEDA